MQSEGLLHSLTFGGYFLVVVMGMHCGELWFLCIFPYRSVVDWKCWQDFWVLLSYCPILSIVVKHYLGLWKNFFFWFLWFSWSQLMSRCRRLFAFGMESFGGTRWKQGWEKKVKAESLTFPLICKYQKCIGFLFFLHKSADVLLFLPSKLYFHTFSLLWIVFTISGLKCHSFIVWPCIKLIPTGTCWENHLLCMY